MSFNEPLSNIGFVCKDHEPKPGGFKGRDPKDFVGRLVKLGFPQPNNEHKEHMWVKVLKLGTQTELEGVLDNDPFYVKDYKYGDGSIVAWVSEPKFEGLYVRYTRRAIRSPENAEMKIYEDVLDIANVTVDLHHQRRGVFTALIQRIRETYPDVGIYVENARPDTLEPLLKRLGFQIALYNDLLGQHSWFLPPITGNNP